MGLTSATVLYDVNGNPIDVTTPLRVDPTGTTTQPVSGTVTANLGSGTGTFQGNKTNNAAVPGATNVGTLGAVANAAAPTWTEANQVALSVDLAGNLRTSTSIAANSSVNVNQIAGATTAVSNGVVGAGVQRVTLASDSTGQVALAAGSTVAVTQATASSLNATVVGTKTNDAAAPGTNNIGTLGAIANAAAPAWTEANLVGLSVDLSGNLRTSTTIAANSSVNVAQIAGTATAVNNGVVGAGVQRVTIASDSTGTTIVTQATASNLNAQVVGSIAHDAADAGNPVKVGGQARTTNPTSVGDGDRVNAIFDKAGRQLAVLEGPRELKTRGNVTLTTTTETTLIAAGGASVFHDMILLTVTSSDQVNLLRLDIRDTTGGTVIWSLHLNAGLGAVGFVVPIPSSLPQTTANTNWTVQLNATPTAGQTVRVFAIAVKNL